MADTKTVVSTIYPTPMWVRYIVRGCLWITGIYALISWQLDLKDFGVSVVTENLFLKYMAMFSTVISMVARFIGVKPVKFDTDHPDPKGV